VEGIWKEGETDAAGAEEHVTGKIPYYDDHTHT
jgi:hypothetical protein